MPDFTTSKGRLVDHFHIGDTGWYQSELSADDLVQIEAILAGFPNAERVGEPTLKFNCHGFAYARAQGYFYYPTLFDADDFTEVPLSSPRKGDVVSYRKNNRLKHSGIVEQVSGGKIMKVRSKWGAMATVIHDLHDVPTSYGAPSKLHRRLP